MDTEIYRINSSVRTKENSSILTTNLTQNVVNSFVHWTVTKDVLSSWMCI